MRKSKVSTAQRLSCVPNQDVGDHAVIQITTHLPSGTKNSFYMDPTDLNHQPVVLFSDHPPLDPPIPTELNYDDDIEFDIQDGIHKAVLWNGRKFRQKDYSFDSDQDGYKVFDGTIFDDHKK